MDPVGLLCNRRNRTPGSDYAVSQNLDVLCVPAVELYEGCCEGRPNASGLLTMCCFQQHMSDNTVCGLCPPVGTNWILWWAGPCSVSLLTVQSLFSRHEETTFPLIGLTHLCR